MFTFNINEIINYICAILFNFYSKKDFKEKNDYFDNLFNISEKAFNPYEEI